MTRRQALFALLAMPIGFFQAYRADAAAKLGTDVLRIPLDQWRRLEVQFGGKSIVVTPGEIFEALGGKL